MWKGGGGGRERYSALGVEEGEGGGGRVGEGGGGRERTEL